MSQILIAWELGENWGHLSRDLPIILELKRSGHNLLCAVADTRIAEEILGPVGIPFVQAPRLRGQLNDAHVSTSHADILVVNGYCHQKTLHGLISAWLVLYDLFKPDAIVLDYAPTANLAARIRRIPTALIGTGFEIPPASTPLPSFKPWDPENERRIKTSESLVLQSINRALVNFTGSPLNKVADAFSGDLVFLSTFKELDHFPGRGQATYIGPVYHLPEACPVDWLIPSRRFRIFAYLRPSMPGIGEILDSLASSDFDAIVVIPGASDALMSRYHNFSGMRLSKDAVEIERLLPSADLVIGYGSGTMATSLLAGVPMLLLPVWAEQYLAAMRVAELGAGVIAHATKKPYSILIKNMLCELKYKNAAMSFSIRHKSYNMRPSIESVAHSIHAIRLGQAIAR